MKRLLSDKLVATIFLLLCSGAAFAGTGTDDVLDIIFLGAWYGFLVVVGLIFAGVYLHRDHGDDLGGRLPG